MYKVKFTRIASNHTRLRTDTVEGECDMLPAIGHCFFMTGPGLEFGVRLVNTSPVKEIIKDEIVLTTPEQRIVVFKTENSEYQLEVISSIA